MAFSPSHSLHHDNTNQRHTTESSGNRFLGIHTRDSAMMTPIKITGQHLCQLTLSCPKHKELIPQSIFWAQHCVFCREPNCIFESYLEVLCIETSTSLGSLQKCEENSREPQKSQNISGHTRCIWANHLCLKQPKLH